MMARMSSSVYLPVNSLCVDPDTDPAIQPGWIGIHKPDVHN